MEQIYKERCERWSDIQELLPILNEYAKKCSHVTEFGVRAGNSTVAFLAAGVKKLVSYDCNDCRVVEELRPHAVNTNIVFILADTGADDLAIEETDMLFIDTLHNYEHVKKELRAASKVRKYLAFHDVVLFGDKDEIGDGPGINKAIEDFMADNPEWSVELKSEKSNGLLILKRA